MPLLPPLKTMERFNRALPVPNVRSMNMRRSRLITGAALCAILLFVAFAANIHTSKPMAQPAGPSANVPAITTSFSNADRADRTTPADFNFSLAATRPLTIDPLFMDYYNAHAGATMLGAPLTVAYQLPQGLVQFFTYGALFLPVSSVDDTSWDTTHFGDLSQTTFQDGQRDSTTGIVQLPLLYALLLAGSALPIGGDTSTLNYKDLRTAAQANTLIAANDSWPPTQPHGIYGVDQDTLSIFIAEGHIGGTPIGHSIPESIWNYINRPDITPDGWNSDIGIPLSQVLPFNTTQNGVTHQLEIQVFTHTALLMDPDTLDDNGQPTIQRLNTGLAYLETLGPPAPKVLAGRTIWGTSMSADTPILGAPTAADIDANNKVLLSIGLNFPLTLMGSYQWTEGILWYQVQWNDRYSVGIGWVPAGETTFRAPDAGSAIWSSFDPLSSKLAQYLSSQGSHVSAVVFDETHDQYYLYNAAKRFYMASSVKVPIMLTLLTQLEQQGREPNESEMSLLTTMIENSNNDSAQALFDEIGGAPALDSFMKALSIGNFSAFPDAWGYSVISTLSMVKLLTLLHDGKILTAEDRGLALNLMENIEPDEQIGVGTAAPAGATVAMKDGWVPAPDNSWVMNTSGIVTVGHETYIIAVYTQEDSSLQQGWDITQHVCSTAGQLLP